MRMSLDTDMTLDSRGATVQLRMATTPGSVAALGVGDVISECV